MGEGGEVEIGYTIVRAYVWEKGGGCAGQYRVCKCVPLFGAVNLFARHVPSALFMGFYKEKCYFCLVYRQMERGRERNKERERGRKMKRKGDGRERLRQGRQLVTHSRN